MIPARITTVPAPADNRAPTFEPLAVRARRIDPNSGALYVEGNFGVCSICFIYEIDTIALLRCGHGYCHSCATRLIVNGRVRCPECRKEGPCDELTYIPLERGLRDNYKQFMASLGLTRALVADRASSATILPIRDPAVPLQTAYFGVASAPCGFQGTIISIPPAADLAEKQDKAVVYVVDESGSMRNDLANVFQAIQAALEANLGGYAAVIVFACTAKTIMPPHRVTEETVQQTMAALYATKAEGGTQMDQALKLTSCVAEEMRELIAQGNEQGVEQAVIQALVVTDGEASNAELAAQVLASTTERVPIYVVGFGANYNYNNCHDLYKYSTQSAANFIPATSAGELTRALINEQRVHSSVQVSCPAGSQVYSNGRVAPVGVNGVVYVTFPPADGIRFAVGGPAALDPSTLMIGGRVAAAEQHLELGFDVSSFMSFMVAMQYVMELGNQLHHADTQTLCSLLTRTRTTLREIGASMDAVVRVIDEQLARAAATDRGGGDDPNGPARLASCAIRANSACP